MINLFEHVSPHCYVCNQLGKEFYYHFFGKPEYYIFVGRYKQHGRVNYSSNDLRQKLFDFNVKGRAYNYYSFKKNVVKNGTNLYGTKYEILSHLSYFLLTRMCDNFCDVEGMIE